jgi:fibronectin-binding autotransporter adhesin
MPRASSSVKHLAMCALLTLTAPLAAMAQQTVFLDTFGTSSLNQTNIAGGIPGGIPTASQTSYTIGSAKNTLATTVGSGHLMLIQSATSSGNMEAQALFTQFPVSLASVGDYLELTYTFTEYAPIMQSSSSANEALFVGLFNSGGVAPQSGAILQNGGFSSGLTTAATGGTANWVGYSAQYYNGASSRLYARPVQTTLNNNDQQVLYNYPTTLANGGAITAPSPNLTPGQQYTMQLRITLGAAGQLAVSNALYAGAGISGTPFTNMLWVATGANLLTTNFDSLAIGYRAADSKIWTNDINNITVVASLAAQAGPYFFVTSSGDPCSGGVSVGLSGSVTTNDYRLYRDNVDTGTLVTGTGAALDFGVQATPGTYTVIASNTITAGVGPMYGSANVFAPGVTIDTQPSSVTVVSNLPASFTVAASGASLSYQWYKNGIPLINNANISGATTPTLNIAAAGAADAATALDGYTVVASTPCGQMATSAPPVSLTLTAPRNLIWAGANPDNSWDHSELNFMLSGSPTAFAEGDNVTFNDASGNTSLAISNDVTPTLISVAGTQSYNFSGPNKITGVAQLVDASSGTLSIVSGNDYTGGTIVSNGATLSLGDGTSTKGSVKGVATVLSGGTLNYNHNTAANSATTIQNAFAGSGTINIMETSGGTLATGLALVSSNFNGTINIQGFARFHASDNNAGYAFGNGSTVNVPANTQAWLDRSATAYNNTFNIAGTGWIGATPNTGAMSIFGCTVNGPINLLADARIGGTIAGGTIQSAVSGPYQLEVWGTTNSYVLVMGPTNGSPQTYASTLITAGSISAANSNAISSGPLTLDVGGDMRVNGNNVTVASLSSINSGSILQIEGARVRNMHATLAGTLTVGTDGSSSQFDGTFSDGGAAPFGLTKVGAGTLTLTAVSTNTGAVTVNGGTLALSGSGSFSKATTLGVATGATLDVNGRSDGKLTLNAGQTLKHSGASTGPINVAGSVDLGSGALLLAVNHSGLAHDSLAASGSVTYNGTLVVTNTGAGLQAGDSFQLFSSGASGFTAFNLQTNDVINNVKYTWNNTVVSDGKVTVASVATLVNTSPTNITTSVNGGNLTLSWPADHIGWTLQSQTNSLNKGLGTNWADVAGSAATNQVIVPIVSTNGSVFFRLKY